MSLKKYKMKNRNDINEDDILYDDNNDISYSDFIFIPERNQKELMKFNLPLSESYEKEKIINELEYTLKNLENKYKRKEKDFNILNINFSKLLYKNKNSSQSQDKLINTIDRLQSENQYLNERLMKYSNRNHFIGVSFIAQDENDDNYLDDKCLEDILDELDSRTNKKNSNALINSQRSSYKNININNPYGNNQYERNEKYYYSSASKFYQNRNSSIQSDIINDSKIKDINLIKNLKDSFNLLMTQIDPSQKAKITIASILKQLGYNDNDILKTIGSYRGVISMPPNNRYKK
jgi:hypothetical protein